MRKSVFKILFAAFLIAPSFYEKEALAFDLGPFEVSVEFCRDTQKIGSILNAFQLSFWPVSGMPGLVTGISMRTSPVVDACNYITQLSQASTLGAINIGIDALNKITEEKHDRQFAVTKEIFSLTNSFVDLKTGKRRQGTMSSYEVASRIGNTMRRFGNMKKRWDKEDKAFEEREEHQRQIQELAKAAKERAIIADILACPDSSKNPDYDAIFTKKYTPLINEAPTLRQDYQENLDYVRSLGAKFLGTGEEYKRFLRVLDEALIDGVKYDQRKLKTEKKKNFVKTGEVDSSGKAITKEEDVPFDIYEYTVIDQTTMKFAHLRNYNPSFKMFVIDFYNRKKKFKEDSEILKELGFKPLNCSPYYLAQGLDPNDSDSDRVFQERKERCLSDQKSTLSEMKNHFDNAIESLRVATIRFKKNQAEVWTLDSNYRGINRAITISDLGENKQEKVSCSQELQVSEMQYLALQQDQVNAKYNEMIAQELVKNNAAMEKEIEQEKAAKKALDETVDETSRVNSEMSDSNNIKLKYTK